MKGQTRNKTKQLAPLKEASEGPMHHKDSLSPGHCAERAAPLAQPISPIQLLLLPPAGTGKHFFILGKRNSMKTLNLRCSLVKATQSNSCEHPLSKKMYVRCELSYKYFEKREEFANTWRHPRLYSGHPPGSDKVKSSINCCSLYSPTFVLTKAALKPIH